MVIDTSDNSEVQRLYSVLEEFKRISPTMPVQQILTFLWVSMHEGTSLKEIAAAENVKVPTMSRHLIDLGSRNRRMEPGHMLIEFRQDPMELRKNQYTISDRGRFLLNAIKRKMGARRGDLR